MSQCTVVWFSQHRTSLVPCMSDIHIDTTSSQVFHQSFVHTPAYTCSVTFSRMSTIHITAVLLSIDPSDEDYNRHHDKCKETVVSKTEKATASEIKTRFSCIAEAHESTRQRIESVMKRIHEEHIAGKGENSVLQYNLVHKFIPMTQAMKIPDAKAAVNKEWKKLET